MIGTSIDIGRIDQPSLIVAERIIIESFKVNNYYIGFNINLCIHDTLKNAFSGHAYALLPFENLFFNEKIP